MTPERTPTPAPEGAERERLADWLEENVLGQDQFDAEESGYLKAIIAALRGTQGALRIEGWMSRKEIVDLQNESVGIAIIYDAPVEDHGATIPVVLIYGADAPGETK